MNDTTDELYRHLFEIDWFSKVGEAADIGDEPFRCRRVSSWSEAAKWAQSEITSWCNLEAGNILAEAVRLNSPEPSLRWNDVAASILPPVKTLVNEVIKPRLPEEFASQLEAPIRSQLLGAFMETEFSGFSGVSLLRNQVGLYELGVFPCGWTVDSPNAFPERSMLVVF